MGVLQRIAICYLMAGLIFLHSTWKGQAIVATCILFGYWTVMTMVDVPGCDVTSISDQTCNLAAYIDRLILTESHIWSESRVFDPEGLLTTIPAIATTIAGLLTGQWLLSDRSVQKKAAGMFWSGIVLTAAGWLWSIWFPLNKSLWTSSFVVYTAGIAIVLFALLYYLIDIKGYRRWAWPFLVFGTNAIALFVGSTIIGRILEIVELPAPNDQTVSLQNKIFHTLFLSIASPINASLFYAIAFVLVWLLLMWLLYRKGIFLKI
jgi:predicted acyltransferase